jgi:serine/threonine protein phosphatase PrpC
VRFSVYQVSRRGGREKNEDRMGYSYTREAGLFALADGMGGHPEGEVAAQLALQAMAAMFQRDAKPRLADPHRFLQDAVLVAHQQILRYAADKGLRDSPRTTVVACVIQHDRAIWAHCGDSRLYLVRGEQLLARTRDHSYLELQEALGRSHQGAEGFNRNVLFTCLGSPGKPMVDVSPLTPLQQGDKLLLCSDGLWGTLSDPHIARQLAGSTITDAVPELVEQALRNGGAHCDNVTALAVEWEGDHAQGPDAAQGEDDADADAVSTLQLDQASFASTMQSAQEAMAGAAELNEEEIERSVREIKAAIEQRRKQQEY